MFYRVTCILAEKGKIKAVCWSTSAGISSGPKTVFPVKNPFPFSFPEKPHLSFLNNIKHVKNRIPVLNFKLCYWRSRWKTHCHCKKKILLEILIERMHCKWNCMIRKLFSTTKLLWKKCFQAFWRLLLEMSKSLKTRKVILK